MHSSCVEQTEGPAAVRPYDPDSVFLSKTVVSLREVFAHAVGHAFDLSPLPTTARTAAAADQTGMADAHGHDEESVQSALPFSGGARPYVASAARRASPSSSPVCVSLPERDNYAYVGVHNAGVSSAPQPTPLLLVVPLDSYHFLLSFRDVNVDNDEQTTGDGAAAGFVAATRHATASIGKLLAASPGCRPPRSGVCVVRRVEGDMRTAQDTSSSGSTNDSRGRREGEGSSDNPYPTLSRVAENLPFVAFDGWVRDYTVFGLSCHTAVLRQAWEEKIQERQPRGDSPHTSTGGGSTSVSREDSPPIAAEVNSADGVKGAEEERQHDEDDKKNHDDTEAAAGEESNASASSPACDDEANGDGVGCDDAMYAGTESVMASPSAEPPADTAKALSPSLDRLDCSSTTASSSSSSVISAGSNTPVPPSPPPPPQQQPQQHEHSQHRDDDDDVVTQAHGNAARTAAAVCVAERSEQERLWSEERRRATAAAAEVRHRFVVADRTQHAIWAIEVSVAQMEVRVVAPAEFYTLNGDEHDGVCDGSRAREGCGGRGRRGDRNSSISSSERQTGSLSRTTTPTTTSQDVATTPQRRRSSHDATAAFPRRRPVTEVTLARHRSGSPSTVHTRHPATRPRSPSPTNPHSSLSNKQTNNNNNRSSHGSAPTQTEDASPPPHHDEEEEVGEGVSGEKTPSRQQQQQQETPLHGDATVGDASPGHAASVSTCAPRRGRSSRSASPSVALAEAVPTPLMGGARGFVDGHFSVARFNQPGALCWRVDEDDEETGNEAEDEENSETRERHQGREKRSARGLDALHSMPLPQRHCSVLFISDVGNCAIRYANFSNRLVRTIAGMDGVPGYRDGSCVSSLLRGATALAWCSAGLLFTDGANNVVRLITHVQKQTSGVTAKEKQQQQQSQDQKAPAAQPQPGGSASCSAASGGDKDEEKSAIASGVRSQEVEEDGKSADHTRDATPTTQTAAALVSNSHDSTRSSAELPSQDSVASSSTAAAAAAAAAAPAIPRVWTLAGSLHGSDISITPLHSRATEAKGEGNAAGAGTASNSATTTTPANSSPFPCSYIDSNRPNRARFGYLSDLALWVDETGSTQLLVLDQTHHAVRLVEAERGVFTYLGPLDYSTDTFPARKEPDRMMRSSQLPSATALPGGLYYPSSLSMTALVKERSPVLLDAQAGGTVLSPQPFLCSSSPLLYVASGVTGEVSVLLPVSHRSTAVIPADSNRNNNKSSTRAAAVEENSARALVLERIQSALTLGVATEGRRSIGEATTPSLKRVVWGRNAEDAFVAAKCQDNKNSDENGESEATARLLQRARVAQALPYLRLRFPWLLPPPVPQLSPQLIAGCTCHLSGKRRGSSQAHPQPRPSAGVSGASPPTQAAARRGRAAVSLSPRAARTLSSSRVTRAASSPLASSPPRHPTPPQQLLFSTPPRHPAASAAAETPPQHQHAHQRVPGPRGNGGGGGGAAAAVAAAANEVAALLGVRLAAQAVVAAAPRIVEVSDDGESEPSLEAVVVVGTQPTPLGEGEDAAPCERVVASLQPQDLHLSSAHTNSSNSGSSSGGGGGDDGGKAEESHDASAQHSQSHSPTQRNNSNHNNPVVELRESGDGEDAASASPSSGGGPAPAAAESEAMPAETKTGRGGPGKPKWLPPPTKSLSRSPVSTPRRGAVDGDDATTPRTADAASYAAKFESLSAEQRQQRLLHTLELQQLPQQDIGDEGKSGNSSLVDDGSRSPHPIEPQQRSIVDGSPQPQVPSSSSSSGSPSAPSPPSAARRKPLRSSSSSAAAGAAASHSPKNSSGRGSPPLTPRAMAAHQLMQRRRTSRSNTAAPHVASVGSTAGAGKAGSREGTSEGHRREDGDRRVPQEVLQPARSTTGWGSSSNSNNSGAGERSHSHTVHEVCEGVVMATRTMGSPAPPSASLAAPLSLSPTAASLHQRYDVAVRRLFTVYSLFATKTVTHAAAAATVAVAPAATTNGTDGGRTVKTAAPRRPSRTVEHYSMSFTAFYRFLILTGYLDYIAGVGRAAAAALAQESGSSLTRQQQLHEHQWSVLLAQVQRHCRASSAAEPAHPMSSSRRHTAAAAGPTGRLSVSTHRTPPSATANASSRHGSLRAGPSASTVAGTPPLVLLPLAVADTRAVADALYSCGVRRQGYHTVACMDFQAFRRAVLLLHTWAETAYSAEAKRRQGNTMRGTIDRDGSDGGRCSEDSAAVFAYVDLTPSLDSLSAERVVMAYAAVYAQALRTVPTLQPRHPDSPTAPGQSQTAALEGRGSVDEENTRKKKAAAARGRTAGSRFQPVLGFDSRTHSPRSSSSSSSSDTENNANGAARSAAEAPVSPPLSPIAAAKHDVSAVVDEPTQDDSDTAAKAVSSTTRGNGKMVSTTEEEEEEEDGGAASLPPTPPYLRAWLADGERLALDELLRLVQRNETTLRQLFDAYSVPVVVHRSHTYAAPHSAAAAAAVSNPCSLLLGESRSLSNSREVSRVLSEPPSQEPVVRTQTVAKRARLPSPSSSSRHAVSGAASASDGSRPVSSAVSTVQQDTWWKVQQLFTMSSLANKEVFERTSRSVDGMPYKLFVELWRTLDVFPSLMTASAMQQAYVDAVTCVLMQGGGSAATTIDVLDTADQPRPAAGAGALTKKLTTGAAAAAAAREEAARKKVAGARDRELSDLLLHHTALPFPCFIEAFVRVAMTVFSHDVDRLAYPTSAAKTAGLMQWCNKQVSLGLVEQRTRKHLHNTAAAVTSFSGGGESADAAVAGGGRRSSRVASAMLATRSARSAGTFPDHLHLFQVTAPSVKRESTRNSTS